MGNKTPRKPRRRTPFLTIATIEGTPLPPATPIDPEQYQRDLDKMVENGLRPPAPFATPDDRHK